MSEWPLALVHPLALLVAFLTSLGLAVPAARLATRLGLVDRPGPRKRHRQPTPYLGGLAVLGGILLAGGLVADASGRLAVVLAGGCALALLGLIDDWKTLAPASKLLGETAAALALWLVGIRAGTFHLGVVDLGFTIAWVIVVTNAVNLLDNTDGAAAGVVAIASLTLAALAGARGAQAAATLSLAVAGASLGFLRHNFPPATIFLGDAGTLLLGFLLAAITLELGLLGGQGPVALAIPVLMLGVPLFDTALVVVDRVRAGRPISVGGTDHTSHRLVALGFSPAAVAVILYAAQLTCAALALLIAQATAELVPVVLVVAAAASAVAMVRLLAVPRDPTAEG